MVNGNNFLIKCCIFKINNVSLHSNNKYNNNMKKCSVCHSEIPEARIKALPNTTTCVQHSNAQRFGVNIVSYGDPEAGELMQEFEIVRDSKVLSKLEHYKQQLGSYK